VLTSLIRLAIDNRFLVLTLTALMAAGGLYSALHLPIDAIPDMTNTQVTVITNAGALSPLEVERYVTYPVEWEGPHTLSCSCDRSSTGRLPRPCEGSAA
jgi:cobalt-zinc-cadmium resistance protein CzcA